MFALSDSRELTVTRTSQPSFYSIEEPPQEQRCWEVGNRSLNRQGRSFRGPTCSPRATVASETTHPAAARARKEVNIRESTAPNRMRGLDSVVARVRVHMHVLSQTSSCVGQQVLVHLTSPLVSCCDTLVPNMQTAASFWAKTSGRSPAKVATSDF